MAVPADVSAEVEVPEDFGEDAAAVAARWISEIELAEKDQSSWRQRGRRIIRRYRDDQGEASDDAKQRRFALFWSNDWTSASGIGYVGAARMQVNLKGDTSIPVVGVGDFPPDLLAVDSSLDNLAVQSGLPFDVPCQLLGFDMVYEPGGQL